MSLGKLLFDWVPVCEGLGLCFIISVDLGLAITWLGQDFNCQFVLFVVYWSIISSRYELCGFIGPFIRILVLGWNNSVLGMYEIHWQNV